MTSTPDDESIINTEAEPICASELFPHSDPPFWRMASPSSPTSPSKSATSLRLLQIHSDAGDDLIQCTLFDSNLEGNPEYIALSYNWHDETLPKSDAAS